METRFGKANKKGNQRKGQSGTATTAMDGTSTEALKAVDEIEQGWPTDEAEERVEQDLHLANNVVGEQVNNAPGSQVNNTLDAFGFNIGPSAPSNAAQVNFGQNSFKAPSRNATPTSRASASASGESGNSASNESSEEETELRNVRAQIAAKELELLKLQEKLLSGKKVKKSKQKVIRSQLNVGAPTFTPSGQQNPPPLAPSSGAQAGSNGNEAYFGKFLARQSVAQTAITFDGNPLDWPSFIATFKRTSKLCEFTEEEDQIRLQQSLKGEALRAVKSLLRFPNNLKKVLDTLELNFGRHESIIKAMINEVRNLPQCKEAAPKTIMELSLQVNNLVATLESVNSEAHLKNPQMLEDVENKLTPGLKFAWGTFLLTINGEPSLKDFARWLDQKASVARRFKNDDTKELHVRQELKKKGSLLNTNKPEIRRCSCCKDDHKLADCQKFKNMDLNDKRALVRREKLCYSCLKPNHIVSKCRTKKVCGTDGCNRLHHALLHAVRKEVTTPQAEEDTVPPKEKEEESNAQLPLANKTKKEILLRVLPITLTGPKGNLKTYALLDEGSTMTLVDKELTKQLGIKGKRTAISMSWTDGINKSTPAFIVNIKVKGQEEEFQLNNVKAIAGLNLPCHTVKTPELQERWEHLRGLTLPALSNSKPRLLIGQDNIHLTVPREIREGGKNAPMATRTKLGWVIHGRNYFSGLVSSSVLHVSANYRDEELQHMVKQYFSLDALGICVEKKLMSKDDERALKIADKTTKRIGQRWETGLLWKNENIELPESYRGALKRLETIERKAARDPQFKQLYITNMQAYFNKGYARKLNQQEAREPSKLTWYLPHFGVVNPNKPGKLRIVFDAAANSNGTSLNDNLLAGPDLLNSLVGMLCKFREKSVAFAADIKEMFPQIRIRKEDTAAQRFLWRNMETKKPVSVCQMDVMIFGAKCSPFSAQEVRNRNALELREKFPLAVDAITKKHYMDDYLDSVKTVEEGREVIQQVINAHQSGGFELRNWISNKRELLSVIPEELKSASLQINQGEALPMERVLGLHWDPNTDSFFFKVNQQKYQAMLTADCLTKRKLLSMVMTLFDPLGLIADCTIKARIIIQDVWRSGVGWDDEVTTQAKDKWIKWIQSLDRVQHLKIPRCYSTRDSGLRELHVFCDASEKAYAAVAYIRTCSMDDVDVNIAISKSRVSPLKPISIPRMELQAALIGARLAQYLKAEHDLKFSRSILWTDSKTALAWIRSDARNFKQFVANRVGEILELSNVNDWRWCPTSVNIADEGTRDAEWSRENNWRKGPRFLYEKEESWPTEEVSSSTNEERKKDYVMLTCEAAPVVPEAFRFSRLGKLYRATARVLQAVQLFKSRHCTKESTKLTMELLERAEVLQLKRSQERCFSKELYDLTQVGKVNKTSNVATLSPYLDEDGIMRLKGRIDRADISLDTKRPIILHPKDPLTVLIIDDYHRKSLHLGQERVINELRQRFWILRARAAVRSAWSRCLICQAKRVNSTPPIMGQLPAARVNIQKHPFSITGMDYFGPIMVTVGRRREKRYGVLFTCLTVRAIHIELASFLTTDSCIMAIKRFSATRGQPAEIYSDNGTNLRGAATELQEMIRLMDTERIEDEMLKKGIKWKFIPPGAPHMGGCWERQIRSVKSGLAVILKERAPREETLLTALKEVEAIVNSSPLTHVPLDHEDDIALTPNHFLIGRASGSTPFNIPECSDTSLRKQWLLSQRIADEFWTRWRKEYLPTLTKRSKWLTDTGSVQIGDVCILVDENQPRGQWPKGVVVNVYPGEDQRVRVVDIRTKLGVFRRPVHKLCLLKINEGESVTTSPRGSMFARTALDANSDVATQDKACASGNFEGVTTFTFDKMSGKIPSHHEMSSK